MSNVTVNETMFKGTGAHDPGGLPREVVNYIWITGIILSSLCLMLQVILFITKPKIRKIDQKMLTQLTVARLMNTILEMMLINFIFNKYTKDLTFALYTQTDAVLICWMFVYTKNLYEKLVLVFVLRKWNFTVLSLMIWILTIPVGLLCTLFLSLFVEYFGVFYKVYAWIKFITLTFNVLFFVRIFYVIVTSRHSERNFSEIIKTCVISFLLVCITSLQVFINDSLSYLDVSKSFRNALCIINSYQVLAVTIIFLILTKNNLRSASGTQAGSVPTAAF